MRLLFLAALAWIMYRVAEENSDDRQPLSRLAGPKSSKPRKPKPAVM